jgi:hypothetical protein
MTLPQRIIHFLGQSTGSLLKVFKLHPKKQKLNPTLLEESNKTLKQTLSLDSLCNGNCKCNCLKPEDALEAYREAAAADDYMFGDYDYVKDWNNDLEG